MSIWWSLTESNRWPPACKAGALPTELRPHISCWLVVGLGRLELPTPRLSSVCSNQLSYRPAGQLRLSLNSSLRLILSRDLLNFSKEQLVVDSYWSGNIVKEVIQPQVPLRLPCYDFTPVIGHTVVSVLPRVRLPTSGATNSHGVTGGVYKARERIHRGILIRDY